MRGLAGKAERERSDRELISRIREVDGSEEAREALGVLLRRYEAQLQEHAERLAPRLCPDGHGVQDFAADVQSRSAAKLIAVVEGDGEIRSLPGLVSHIVRTCAIDERRLWVKENVERLQGNEAPPNARGSRESSTHVAFEEKERAHILQEALETLAGRSDDGLRMALALRLRYLEGRSYAEVGRQLRTQGLTNREPSERTVHRWMRGAEQEFRELLSDEYDVRAPGDL